jgi:hypothetical protein
MAAGRPVKILDWQILDWKVARENGSGEGPEPCALEGTAIEDDTQYPVARRSAQMSRQGRRSSTKSEE